MKRVLTGRIDGHQIDSDHKYAGSFHLEFHEYELPESLDAFFSWLSEHVQVRRPDDG